MPKGGKGATVVKGTELPAEKLIKEPKDGAKSSETKESLREKAALAAAVKVVQIANDG